MYIIGPNNRSLKNITEEALEECFLPFHKLAVDKHKNMFWIKKKKLNINEWRQQLGHLCCTEVCGSEITNQEKQSSTVWSNAGTLAGLLAGWQSHTRHVSKGKSSAFQQVSPGWTECHTDVTVVSGSNISSVGRELRKVLIGNLSSYLWKLLGVENTSKLQLSLNEFHLNRKNFQQSRAITVTKILFSTSWFPRCFYSADLINLTCMKMTHESEFTMDTWNWKT